MVKASTIGSKVYLKADDIPLDVGMVDYIDSVVVEPIGTEPGDVIQILLRDDGRWVTCNMTRRNVLIEKVGNETDDWPGAKLHITRGTTMYSGKQVSCIQIADAKPAEHRPTDVQF